MLSPVLRFAVLVAFCHAEAAPTGPERDASPVPHRGHRGRDQRAGRLRAGVRARCRAHRSSSVTRTTRRRVRLGIRAAPGDGPREADPSGARCGGARRGARRAPRPGGRAARAGAPGTILRSLGRDVGPGRGGRRLRIAGAARGQGGQGTVLHPTPRGRLHRPRAGRPAARAGRRSCVRLRRVPGARAGARGGEDARRRRRSAGGARGAAGGAGARSRRSEHRARRRLEGRDAACLGQGPGRRDQPSLRRSRGRRGLRGRPRRPDARARRPLRGARARPPGAERPLGHRAPVQQGERRGLPRPAEMAPRAGPPLRRDRPPSRDVPAPHLAAHRGAAGEEAARPGPPGADERVWVGLSERAGKDAAGEPILRGRVVDHDLDAVFGRLAPFLSHEGFAA